MPSEMEIRRLIAELDSLHRIEWITAQLIACGGAAVEPLREYLFCGRPSGVYQPRRAAVEALAGLGAKEVLMEYLLWEKEIADPVARFGEEAVESAAAREIGAWREEQVFQLLLEIARRRLRVGVIEALAAFERNEAIPYFDRALEDDFYRPAAEQAFRKLRAAARPALILSALAPLPSAADESPSSLRRRRSVVRLLGEIGIRPEDWSELRVLLDEADAEIAVGAANLAVLLGGQQDAAHAVARLITALPSAQWHLRDEIENCLAAFPGEALPAVDREIARRKTLPEREQVRDPALRTLLRAQARLQDHRTQQGGAA